MSNENSGCDRDGKTIYDFSDTFKAADTIGDLNSFLSGPYPYGHESLTVGELLTEFGKLKEFYWAVRNLAGAFEAGK